MSSRLSAFRASATNIVTQRLREKRLWLCLAILVGLLILYCVAFWRLPLSEDAGLYGYLSRAIANGMVLHRDIFFSSNSIAIYATAFVFRIVGASLDSFRLVHAVGLAALGLAVFFTVSRGKHYGRGLLAASIAGIFSVLPHIILDLGRNYIVWATVFVVLGFSIQSSNAKHKEAYSGILLGTAALIRETFVVAGIGLLAYEIGRLVLHRLQKRRDTYRPVLVLGAAFLLTLSVNAAILTCYGTWGGYLRDMLQSGTSFRYESGLLDSSRLADNLSYLKHGFKSFYFPLLLAAFSSYFVAIRDSFVSYVKFLLVPVFLVEAIVINRTSAYSIIPILVFASILTAYLVFELGDLLNRPAASRAATLRVAASVLVLAGVAAGMVNCSTNAAREFRDYYRLSAEMSRTSLSESTEHTSRLLYIVDLLPHDTVSTYSEYPFLFLTEEFYCTDPFVEDLSASNNMNRPEIWQAQMDYLKTTPTDLMILKTTGTYISKVTDLGKIIDENYIVVYDLPFATGSTPYKNRILLSYNAFHSSYRFWKEETGNSTFQGFNDREDAIMISVTTQLPERIASCTISAGLSKTRYAPEYTNSLVIFSLVPPRSEFKVEMANGVDTMDQQFRIRYYVRSETE